MCQVINDFHLTHQWDYTMVKYILPLLLLHSTSFHKGSKREVISREALPVFLAVSNYLAVGYMSVVSWSYKSFLGEDAESASETLWE